MKTPCLPHSVAFSLTLAFCNAATAEPDITRSVYHAKVRVVVQPPKGVDPIDFVRAALPKPEKEDPAITVERVGKSDPAELELGVKDSDSQRAADRVNAIAKALDRSLNRKTTIPPIFGVASYATAPKERSN